MKKRVLALLLTGALAMSMFTACGSKETGSPKENGTEAETEVKEKGEYQFVSTTDAVAAAKEGKTHVLDVREWSNYAEGRIEDSEWCPIFPLEDDSLVDQMKTYAKDKLSDGEKIYIVCNSGQKGAQKATGVLKEAGVDESLIYTVEGGAKALAKEKGALTTNRVDENIDWQYVKGTDVLSMEDPQIVDVRDDKTYEEGHLKDTLQVDLKDVENPDAQTAMYDLSGELDKDKPVYFLCYSGNKCAKTGVSVLKDAGFDPDNLFIIQDGAKDSDISAAFVK
ncbi:rhodanese-like domain-containing protein [Clostridium sp. C105KSO13]|uniref:rhodanese-like domain-containing protein n=1 Tax=Clostridium sp. C105KSO13 TaxID=1776045 RepID=UPI0007406460|nr:rhodanese-like domain-containing protein [Clostridium sp. C105KSO13]CUX48860.1 thiosulfate sulfurtransferase [Clostridium sp. C105KSO13]